MAVDDLDGNSVTPDLVLSAYRARCFPMAEDRDQPLAWFRPQTRAIITWDAFRVPRSLRRFRRRSDLSVTFDRDFAAVVAACAERQPTWLSHDVERLFLALHQLGHAHSVEAWDRDGALVGGTYGLVLGSCFGAESMFHRAANAGKLCLVVLVERLIERGFHCLDCQQMSPTVVQLGATEISDRRYAELLGRCWPERRTFP